MEQFVDTGRCTIRVILVWILAAGIVLNACSSNREIAYNDPRISISAGKTLFQGQPFTGTIRQPIPAVDEVRLTPYKNGLMHGTMESRNSSGRLLLVTHYVDGQKHGLQRAWYPDGKNLSYGEFVRGHYVGDHWVWHNNGKVLQFDRYDNDGQILAAKRWRSNGIIYMNFVYRNGEPLGLPGSKVCNPTKESNQSSL